MEQSFSSDDESRTLPWVPDDDLMFLDEIEGHTADAHSDNLNDGTSMPLCTNRRRMPNRIRKGAGPHGKAHAPDKHDGYRFEEQSPAFFTLMQLGYHGISLLDIIRVCAIIETTLLQRNIRLTYRNRAARRRKPCAFHWIDENWPYARNIYPVALHMVLGSTSGSRKRGPKKTDGEPRLGMPNPLQNLKGPVLTK
jgi:hypothetical protein